MDERLRLSRQHERSSAGALGARVHKGSGSGNHRQDAHSDELLIECKTVLRGRKQITLKASALKQLACNAAIDGQIGVCDIEVDGRAYVLVPREDLAEIMGVGRRSKPNKRGGKE